MNEELILKAMELFDTPEKWNAFNELASKRNALFGRWWKKLQTKVFQIERNEMPDDWDIDCFWDTNFRWYIKGDKPQSLCIHFFIPNNEIMRLRVFYGFGALDQNKVSELYQSKFSVINSCFDRLDNSSPDTIGMEYGNYTFGSIYDGNFPDNYTLSWYAGNRTEDFANQIIAKVRKFQTPEITALFKEINEKCRKG